MYKDCLTLHTHFTQQSVFWIYKPQGALLGLSNSVVETGWLHLQSSTGRVHSDPSSRARGNFSILPSFCARSACHRTPSIAFHPATIAHKLGRWLSMHTKTAKIKGQRKQLLQRPQCSVTSSIQKTSYCPWCFLAVVMPVPMTKGQHRDTDQEKTQGPVPGWSTFQCFWIFIILKTKDLKHPSAFNWWSRHQIFLYSFSLPSCYMQFSVT